jgi:hypothetical protein
MPPGSTVWSAKVAGRPIRPGVAERGAVLLPLEKGRAGEEAPTFVVEMIYLQRIQEWTDKGVAQLALPALDLPVSRTGVELHHSPRFRVELRPGTFRVEEDPGMFAEALRGSGPGSATAAGVAGGQVGAAARDAQDASKLQALVDRFRNESGGRTVVGSLPVHVTFPQFGPSIFLASELTAESNAPSIELAFKRH